MPIPDTTPLPPRPGASGPADTDRPAPRLSVHTAAAPVAPSGDVTIDAMLWGSRWAGPVTFADAAAPRDYGAAYFTGAFADYRSAFAPLAAGQIAALHAALDGAGPLSVAAFTRLDITYRATGAAQATLRLGNVASDVLPTAQTTDFPANSRRSGDIWFGGAGRDPVPGNHDWMTVLHELGHALGLKHPHGTLGRGGLAAPALPLAQDSIEYSVMSYRSFVGADTSAGYRNAAWDHAQGWMMLDIRALQALYGADYGTRSGDTVYSWRPDSGETCIDGRVAVAPGANRIFLTIWDGGGTDTYDLSAYAAGVEVDLRPGGHSVLSRQQRADLDAGSADPSRVARGNVFNALLVDGDPRSLIENAIGGSGADRLSGNSAANRLSGQGGGDTLHGGAGDDVLSGCGGNDILAGGAGRDLLIGGPGRDRIGGGEGDDLLTGGPGADVFVLAANAGGDVITDFDTACAAEVIDLSALRTGGWDALASAMAASGQDTLIPLAGGTLVLSGVRPAALSPDDFLF